MNTNNLQLKDLLNKQITVKINSININGEGVSEYNNKKVCVDGVLPQEEVLCEVESQKASFLGCKKIKLINKNKNRVVPKCKYSGVCGGCNLDFVDYKNAASLKIQIIQDYFTDLYDGQVDFVQSNFDLGYRNKIAFFVFDNKLGLKQKASNKIVEIDKCLIASKKINNIVDSLKESLKYIKSKSLTHIVVRDVENTLIVSYVFKNYEEKSVSKLKQFVLTNFSCSQNIMGFYVNINNKPSQILGDVWYHIFGLEYNLLKFEDKTIYIHPQSFLQVNEYIMKKIYKDILLEVENNLVVEGYSGVGIMSTMLTNKAKKVYSVEIDHQSYLSAEKNKKDNKIDNLININDSCHNVLPKLVKQNPNSVFLIDPPRSGCDKQTLDALNDSGIKKIIYISCNPYTLKQNLVYLKNNYKIQKLTVYDMFPNTSHVETVAILKRI